MHAPRCHPALESDEPIPSFKRTGCSADTPLPLTVEIPVLPTWPELRPFGAQLPDPFRSHVVPGFHQFPARFTTDRVAYSFRSSQIRLFNCLGL